MRNSPLSSVISVRRASANDSRTSPELLDHDLHQQAVAGEDGLQPLDRLEHLGQLVLDLLPLEAGEPLQLHVEDGLRLDGRQAEGGHQALARLGGVARRADERDHLVEVVEGDLQAFQDVGPRLGLPQLELGPPPHHVAPEVHEVVDHLDQRQDARAAADNRQHDDAERRLQRGVLVEVVQDDVRQLAALQVDHDAHAVAVRLVAQVRDALDRLLAHQFGDLLDEPRLVHLVRDLGDDDRRAVALLRRLDFGLGADDHRPAARPVGLRDAGPADDHAAGREVGAGQDPPHRRELLVGARLGVLDGPDDAVDDLAQVVRRDVGGHADRDPRRAVDQQVRERRRQDGGLLGGFVVVRDEVDGVLVEVHHQGLGQRLQPRLGVAHGRGRVAVDRSEVALAVDQGVAQVEVLRHAHEGVVDGAVAVGMVVAHHLADDLRALAVRAVRGEAHLAHAEQHAAVRRLQAVADVRQRPPDDHAHGVIQVRALHFIFDRDGYLARGIHLAR